MSDSLPETNPIPRTENPIPTIVTVDCATSTTTERTKSTSQPVALKPSHRNSEGGISQVISRSTETDDIFSTSAPRRFMNFFLFNHTKQSIFF